MKCPEQKVKKELLGGELLADQFTVSKLAGHLGVVSGSEFLLLIVEALKMISVARDSAGILRRDALEIMQAILWLQTKCCPPFTFPRSPILKL